MATHITSDDRELRASLDRLFSLQTFGIKLGLDPITALLERIGNPHRRFPAVHVAGTNGKGSVTAMIASTLQAAGYRVGLYTSPHLVRFNERIRVMGTPIADERLALYTREMLPMIEEIGCTFFEGTTAMGFRYFAEEEVDVAVIETGLGGRLDATNVLTPLVTAVTSIGMDHTKHLGDSLEQIAYEKAGILKPETPAVIGPVAPYLRAAFQDAADRVGARMRFVEDFTHAARRAGTPGSVTASFIVDGRSIPDLLIDLPGRYQIDNARVALGVLEALRDRFPITDEAIRAGFASTRSAAGIRGRFEVVHEKPRVILDVAHNPDGARVLVETLRHVLAGGAHGKVRFVYGAVQDKDVGEIVSLLAPVADALYAVRADNPRSLPAEEIYYHADRLGLATTFGGTVSEGLRMALRDSTPDDTVVACGSFFVVADAIALTDTLGKAPATLVNQGVSEPGFHYSVIYKREAIDDAYMKPSGTFGSDGLPDDGPMTVPDDATTSEDDEPKDGDERLAVKDWSNTEQPRERLMELGPRALTDAELLAILLRTGKRGEDVLQLSRKLLHRFGNIMRLVAADHTELQQIPGIGPAKAVALAAAFELGRRMRSAPFGSRPVINSPADIARIYIPLLRGVHKEQFHVLALNSAGQVIRMELISEGSMTGSVVHPREVFRRAIIERAASIVGLHNHPSGNPTPSSEDLEITRQLIAAGRIINIPFHDHIIIAGDDYISLSERGLM